MLRAASRGTKRVETLLPRPSRLQHFHVTASSSSGLSATSPTASLASCGRPTSRNDDHRLSLKRQMWTTSAKQSLFTSRTSYSTLSAEQDTAVDSVSSAGSSSQKVRARQGDADVTEGVQEKFQRLGLNANISRQLTLTHPHIQQPTTAQSALIPAILSPTDVILRAHTGTGKSFGILLALLSKPRILFRHQTPQDAQNTSTTRSKSRKPQTGIASIILVPSNELAFQYLRWARSLLPASSLPSLDPVIQCLVRGGLPGPNALTAEQELKRLKATPPHILIGTPGRIKDILDTPAGSSLLGIDTLRTLVLDEADAVLQLPGRFPSYKQKWKHEVHKAPGLLLLDSIMKRRATYSGGEKNLSAGLENRPGKRRDEKRPPEHIRRNAYKAAERAAANREDPNTGLALPRQRGPGVHPLQVVCTSATANSVMRHFFGARTGWLRTGAKESGLTFAPQVGRWIDLTGLSGQSMVNQGIRGLFGVNERTRADDLIQTSLDQTPSTMPSAIQHTCVVVDEAPLSKQLASVPLRNFEPKLARKKGDALDSAIAQPPSAQDAHDTSALGDEYMIIKPDSEPQEHEMDQTLIEALAFCFASEGVNRGLALIPARWSLFKTRAALEALGVTVRLANDVAGTPGSASTEGLTGAAGPELFLLQSTSSRGLDIPTLSHVFLIGYASVIDAVQYVHAAGRVARIGGDANAPATGKVVTLLRGLPHDTPLPDNLVDQTAGKKPKMLISTSESRMANVYRRLGVVPKKFDLGLLTSGAASVSRTTEQADNEAGPAERALQIDPMLSEAPSAADKTSSS